MKSVCSKGLALLLAAVLVLALGGCGNGKGYLPSQNATWGELCRHFQPEWFDSLPEEVQPVPPQTITWLLNIASPPYRTLPMVYSVTGCPPTRCSDTTRATFSGVIFT